MAVVLTAFAASVTALAASGYSVGVTVSAPVVSGHSFAVTARGVAQQKALLYVYLDPAACRATSNKEARSDGAYRAGQSYFLQDHGGNTVKEPFDYAWVSGSFRKSFTAHAGSSTGRHYACAYLDRPNRYGGYRVTAVHASVRYTVKK